MADPQGTPSWSPARATIIGVALGAVVVALVTSALRARSDASVVLNVAEAPDVALIRVYVGGEVAAPGIYTLDRGSRVSEAIEAAGGPTNAGDTTSLRMAGVLADGDQVVVPKPMPTPRAATPGQPIANPAGPPSPIDINRAVAAELDSLPGIGPKLAERIIEYRDSNGPFTAVDDLAEVRGISERMVEILRPLVTVGP